MKRFAVFATLDGEIGAIEISRFRTLPKSVDDRITKVATVSAFSSQGALINAPRYIEKNADMHRRLTMNGY